MNIFEFINSNTVRKHLEGIGYEPDSLTAAFIVWQSKSHTLAEKEKAFEWIIENMPDMPIPAHEYHSERASLHEFLKEYVRTLSECIKRFQADVADAIYDFWVCYKEPKNAWVYDENVYSSYKDVFDAILYSFNENYDEHPDSPRPVRFNIRRISHDIGDYLYLTPNLEPYKFSADPIMSDENYETLNLFENLCLPIPHPFKKGDIIREIAGKYALPTYYNDTLVVTDYMSEEEIKEKYNTLCMHDYTLYGICSDGEGGTYEDSISHYLDAELIEPGEVLIKDSVLVEKSEKLKGKRND